MKIRTRFSPSPTGMMHLGNARSALFSALYAGKHNGTFILRIEDTDVSRSEEKFVESLQEDLHWLHINWQEGPNVNGEFGPYWQSQRQNIYTRYYKLLTEQQLIYPCFCTDQELALARKLQLSRGQPPRYLRTCLKLSVDEIKNRIQEGKKPAWRFKVPDNVKVEFVDVIKGPQQFQSNDMGDFIIRRTDGTAPFLFCNAIDDALMKVSHVLRGEDHLANTPRQILLLQALQLMVPHYGHLSLIVGDDGAPLSKRHGSFSVQDLKKQGYLAIAVINYLARLGHTCDSNELLDFDHLVFQFNLEKVSRSPARFDKSQLMYWQKLAVQSLDINDMRRWLGERISAHVPQAAQVQFLKTIQTNIEFPEDALLWAKIFFYENVEIGKEELQILQEAGEQFFVEAQQAVDTYDLQLPEVLNDMKKTLGVNGKKLFLPFRVALTGKLHGPELKQIVDLLGVKKIKHRLGMAIKLASNKAS